MSKVKTDRDYYWGARERITIDATTGGVGFTATTIKPTSGDLKGIVAKIARCKLETAQIRTSETATAPTALTGQLRNVFEGWEVKGASAIKAFRGIRTGSTSGVIDVEYGW